MSETPGLRQNRGWDLAALDALAREVNGRVEVRSWVQDSEGRWYWSDYAAALGTGTWSAEMYDDQVKVEARIVSDWEPVDRATIQALDRGQSDDSGR